jgi:hypothetical protein
LLKGLSIELALIDALEKRVQDGKGSWRRAGASIAERELAAWRDSIVLKKPRDYRRFIPPALARGFTVGTLAEEAEISKELARKTLYVLNKIGVVERTGKTGRAFTYRLAPSTKKRR